MTNEEKAWLQIAAISRLGPKRLWKIAESILPEKKSASWLIEHPERLQAILNISLKSGESGDCCNGNDIDFDELERNDIEVLHPLREDFPVRLAIRKEKADIPPILFARGNLQILKSVSVSIVGSRVAARPAIDIAMELAGALAGRNVNVTSGYANGVDLAAHAGAIRSGGTTTAVLAEGIFKYRLKPELRSLAVEGNLLVVSQFNPQAVWTAYNAMNRNNVVCALSDAVVVVHSGAERDSGGRMSGSFDAGLSALKMNIPLFVVTPTVLEGDCEGNSRLIDEGGISWNPSDGIDEIMDAARGCFSTVNDKARARKRQKPANNQLRLNL